VKVQTSLIPIVLILLTTGCTTAARRARPLSQAGSALFTSATFSDLKLTGIKTGPAHGMVLLPDRLTWTAR
jgi:hypothetical protein